MEYPKELDLNCNTCTEKSIKIHYPEFWNHLTSHYPKDLTWGEKLYWFYHNLVDYPKCKVCASRVGFTNFRIGYKKYCCRKCLNSDPIKKEKTKQTCIERYGGCAPASSKLVVQKMQNTSIKKYGVKNIQYLRKTKDKTKQTCIERYGGQGNGSNILLEKYQNTSLRNHGAKNPMSSPDIQNKLKQTFINTYGVDHPSKIKSVKCKIQQSRRETEMKKHPFIKGYTIDGKWICKCPHEECNKCQEKQFITPAIIYEGRLNEKIEICTNLLPIGKDKTKNTSIELFIQELLEQYNIEYQTNTRIIIPPKELDIYIPSKKLAIECNGVFSHSSKFNLPNYHVDKT